jgi:hypothetical protein
VLAEYTSTSSPISIGTNEGHLPPELIGWLKPWPRDTPDDILRHELKTKGVVHIKNAMPREYVLGIRERYVGAGQHLRLAVTCTYCGRH